MDKYIHNQGSRWRRSATVPARDFRYVTPGFWRGSLIEGIGRARRGMSIQGFRECELLTARFEVHLHLAAGKPSARSVFDTSKTQIPHEVLQTA